MSKEGLPLDQWDKVRGGVGCVSIGAQLHEAKRYVIMKMRGGRCFGMHRARQERGMRDVNVTYARAAAVSRTHITFRSFPLVSYNNK